MANADTASPALAARKPKRLRAICRVKIAGVDVTNVLDPYLISVSVQKGQGIPTANIELDDRYGRIKMPVGTEPIEISLGWVGENPVVAFQGTVNDIESSGQKRAGRRMTITAFGLDIFAQGKEPRNDSWTPSEEGGTVTVDTALKDAAGKAGFSIEIDPSVGARTRSSIVQTGESFMNFAYRIAGENGGLVRVDGNKIIVAAADEMNSAAAVNATVGPRGNVIGWRIHPMAGRPTWQRTSSHWFDPKKAGWFKTFRDVIQGKGAFAFGQPTATYDAPFASGDQAHAESQALADGVVSQARRGYGWILIVGEPLAQALGPINVDGCRPGVDGTYRITELTHEFRRGGGFTTRCEVDQPGASGVTGPGSFEEK